MPTDAEFMRRLRAGFAEEAAERAQTLDSALVEMQSAPEPARQALVEAVFREAHSIKGAARAVDLVEVEGLCQALEDVFSQWRRESAPPLPGDFDVLHRAVDFIRAAAIPDGPVRGPQIKAVLGELSELRAGKRAAPSASTPAPVAEVELPLTTASSVRIPAAKLDAVLLQAEELLLAKTSARRSAGAAHRLHREYTEW
jgi:two-component system chemotaxis sensor kinase CheA